MVMLPDGSRLNIAALVMRSTTAVADRERAISARARGAAILWVAHSVRGTYLFHPAAASP